MNSNTFSQDEEENEWKNREIKRFDEKIIRRRWIRAIERTNGMKIFYSGMPFKVPIPARYLYWDGRDAFIHGLFFSSINTIASCIEATFVGRIDPYLFEKIKPRNLTLFTLKDLSLKNGIIEFDLAYQLHEFRVYRNNVIHSKTIHGNELYLSEVTHYSGRSKTSRSIGWQADQFLYKMLKNAPADSRIDREKLKGVVGISTEEVAKLGLELFFSVREKLL